jgi:predicted  nucleic acid-binding Zn-ribbon protein
MSRASSLYRLQTLDTDLDRRNARLQEIETVLSDAGATARTREALAQAEARLQTARAEVHTAETTLEDHRLKVEGVEKALYGGAVRNPKELQDLQNEVESLHRYHPTLENRLLEAMLAFEEKEIQHKAASKELERVQELEATRNETLLQKREEERSEIERLESEREAALVDVSAADQELYRQLRASRGGVAVARLEEDSCGACGLIQSHSIRQSIRMAADLHLCKQCGRILYAG